MLVTTPAHVVRALGRLARRADRRLARTAARNAAESVARTRARALDDARTLRDLDRIDRASTRPGRLDQRRP